MNVYGIFLFFTVSLTAVADDCKFEQASEVMNAIKTSKSCYEAEKVANDCMRGDHVGAQFAYSAVAVCEKSFFKKLSATPKTNYKNLSRRCFKKYEKESGSIYRAFEAYCSLKAASAYESAYTPVSE